MLNFIPKLMVLPTTHELLVPGPDGVLHSSAGPESLSQNPEHSDVPFDPPTPLLFDTVLFPTDFSGMSTSIISQLGKIPGIKDLMLIHFQNETDSSARQQAERQIAIQKEQLGCTGINVMTRVDVAPDGSIPRAILKANRTDKAALIVIGARKGILSGSLLGRCATDVLTRSQCHVLIMRSDSPRFFSLKKPEADPNTIVSKILYATDFSSSADDALNGLKRINGISEVILLHVIQRNGIDPGARERNVKEVEERLNRIHDDLKSAGISSSIRIRYGTPSKQICMAAAEENATMILMSRYGRMDYLMQIPVGNTTKKVAKISKTPVLVFFSEIHLVIRVRELLAHEFQIAEIIWLDYHQNKSDRNTDRIFCVFVEDTPVSVSRCKRHTDGIEVDGVFTWEEFRGKGYARMAMEALVSACGDNDLYMHATLPLVTFYKSLGFTPIPEKELPPTIRERYAWAIGDMGGSDVCPMKRIGTA